jgi:glycerol-3-phosphate dehydrogenase (NAD(P)+)
MQTVGILGGGAWGTALALVAARAGRAVTLWARDPATVLSINDHHENPRYLDGVALAPAFAATGEIGQAAAADIVVLAVPSQMIRAVAALAAPAIAAGRPVVVAAKGLERGSDRRLTEVLAEAVPAAARAVLSGPSFAIDVARGLPTAVTIAAEDEALALDLCKAFSSPTFRPYAETDVVGVEIGGAVKNVLAIASGIVAGRKLGASAGAALIARGFAELRRFAEALGAKPETLMGLSGLGDLVLTASSHQSRNFSYGFALGEDNPGSAEAALVEGRVTAAVVRDIAGKRGIDMPVSSAVAAIVEGSLAIEDAVEGLMTRPLKREAG